MGDKKIHKRLIEKEDIDIYYKVYRVWYVILRDMSVTCRFVSKHIVYI